MNRPNAVQEAPMPDGPAREAEKTQTRHGAATESKIAVARRALGAQLAALREAAGLTQHDLAPLVGYGRSTVGSVEIGKQRVPRLFWMHCDQLMATGGVLTEAYDRIESMQREAARAQARALEEANSNDLAEKPLRGPVDVGPALGLHWTRMLHVMVTSHNLFGPRQIHETVCRESAVIRRYRQEAVGEARTGLLTVRRDGPSSHPGPQKASATGRPPCTGLSGRSRWRAARAATR